MARQVYFDPFGMRTQGYRQGVQDEIDIQDRTRRARASDFDFENFAPLRLNAAQRQDELGMATQPYLLRQLPRTERLNEAAVYSALDPILGQIAARTGYQAPRVRQDLGFVGVQADTAPTMSFDPETGQFYDSGQPNVSFTGADIAGQPTDIPLDPQTLLQNYEFAALQPQAQAMAEQQLAMDEFGLQQLQTAAEIRRQQARSQYLQNLINMGINPITGQPLQGAGGASGAPGTPGGVPW